MLVRYYWDEAGAFIASDDGEFAEGFAAMFEELGHPYRIRVGPREGVSTDYAPGDAVERDDSICDGCGSPHSLCVCEQEG